MRASAVALLALLVVACPFPAAAARGDLGEAELELRQAERMLTELRGEVGDLQAEGYSFVPEERFIDAQVYFDLQHFDKSALLLTSLVDDPRFRKDRKYFDAVRLLGIAHFNQRNYQGAHRQFQRLRDAGVYSDLATTYLVEIAARLGRADELRQLASSIPAQGVSEGLLYARGKALYFIGDYGGALDVMRRVPLSADNGRKAQYIAGASLVALNRNDDALRVFQSLVDGKVPDTEENRQLTELAYLSLGRLAYETGEFSAAADYYQHVPRRSEYFEQALYEVTHVHLRWAATKATVEERMRSYSKAEEILDILVSITRNPQVARDARVLRGRISMYLEKYEQASEAYQQVIEMFAATSSEMTDIARNPETIDRFFEAMIRGGDSDQRLNLFVSQEVITWMRNEPTLARVVEMLTDVADQRATLEEARAIYQQLTYSLSQEAAREVFPGFSDVWLKSLEVENRLLEADRLLLEAERKAVAGRIAGAERTRLEQLLRDRKALEDKLATAPRTVGAYRARSRDLLGRVRRISRDADEQILRIERIREQILAMQKLLNEVKYKGSTMIEVSNEDDIERAVRQEGEKLGKLLEQARALRADVEKEMLVAEVGDPRSRSEQSIKSRLWGVHRDEAAFYIDLSRSLDAEAQRPIERANAMRRQIFDARAGVEEQQDEIDRKALTQIEHFKKALAREKIALARRQQELNLTEKAAMQFARQVGSALFLKAKEELVKAVVEADLGLVDLTWKRKQQETERIQQIQTERGEVVKRLRDDLRAIAGDSETEK